MENNNTKRKKRKRGRWTCDTANSLKVKSVSLYILKQLLVEQMRGKVSLVTSTFLFPFLHSSHRRPFLRDTFVVDSTPQVVNVINGVV